MPELKPDNTDRETLAAIADSVALLGKTVTDSLKALTDRVDATCARMDAMEDDRKDDDDDDKADRKDEGVGKIVEKGDPKEVVADRKDAHRKDDDDDDDKRDDKRKDSEGEKQREGYVSDRKDEDKEKAEDKADRKDDDDADMADSAARADIAALKAQIRELQARSPAIMADSEREKFASIQEAADPAYQAFGDKAPAPLAGETPMSYKRRLAGKMQSKSDKWKDSRLSAIADEATLDMIFKDVMADSLSSARRGADVPAGSLRPIQSRTAAGHTMISYAGDPSAWMGHFKGSSVRA